MYPCICIEDLISLSLAVIKMRFASSFADAENNLSIISAG